MARNRSKRRRRFAWLWARKWPSGRVVWYATWRDTKRRRRTTRALGENKEDAEKFLVELERRLRLSLPTGPLPTQAEQRGADVPVAAEDGKPFVPVFVDYAHHLLEERLIGTLAEATVALYRANVAALRGFFGTREETIEIQGVPVTRNVPGRRLDEITPDAFLAYRVWRRSARRSTHGPRRPVSDATINRDFTFVNMVLNHALVEGLIAKNPLAGMRRLKEMRKGRRVMTKAEVAKLLLAADEDYRPFLMASIYTGCRPCELRALRWRDVLFEPGKLRIDRKKVKLGDVIDLHPALAEELQHHRTRQREAGIDVRAEDPVFQSPHGTPWVNMRRAWRRTLKAAGLEGSGLTPYATRHSFACRYLTCGGNVIDLASQLGHSDVKTTMIYASMVDERRRAGVMALDWGTGGSRPAERAVAKPVAMHGR